jgi:hypothetical protein
MYCSTATVLERQAGDDKGKDGPLQNPSWLQSWRPDGQLPVSSLSATEELELHLAEFVLGSGSAWAAVGAARLSQAPLARCQAGCCLIGCPKTL